MDHPFLIAVAAGVVGAWVVVCAAGRARTVNHAVIDQYATMLAGIREARRAQAATADDEDAPTSTKL